jgi:serine/threonine protein kinase
MDPQKVRQLYELAMARPAGERTVFLLFQCGGDDALRARVQALLDTGLPPPRDPAAILEHAKTLPLDERAAYIWSQCDGSEELYHKIANQLSWGPATPAAGPSPAQPAEPAATPDNRHAQMRRIFDAALTLPVAQRHEYIRSACGGDESLRMELSALLQANDDAGTFLLSPAQAQSQAQITIGPYRVIRELGRGGMGVVYLGMRDDGTFRKAVALKVLLGDRVSQDFLRRFRERQTLANLDHPYIARILDGGDLPDGMPYYVMDYIEGLPLDDYCDQNKLSTTGRIKLFQKICEAVDYLHSHRVVHRDLKPANILVSNDGTPKLLDFGIAKQQGNPELTAAQDRLLTPGYASPEQITGAPVTPSSDIYTLGVILYFLLTGQLPYDDPHAKVANILAGIDPPRPSTRIRNDLQRAAETTRQIRKRIIGDLDNIVLMALRRDPAERYASAKELAEDLQRFLDGHSVLARRNSILERSLKFVKRNRVPVGIAAMLVLALGLGTWQTLQARMLANRAEEREAQIRSLLDLIDSASTGKTSGNSGATPSRTPGISASGSRIEQVRQLRRLFQNDLPAAMSLRPGFTPQRQQLLTRGLQILESIRPYCAQDPDLALETAATYQQIGTLQDNPQFGNLNAALGSFNHAIVLFNSVSGGNPSDPRVQGQVAFLAGRIRALGGSVPVFVAAPALSRTPIAAPATETARIPAAPALPQLEPAAPASRRDDPIAIPEPSAQSPSQSDYSEIKERLISVTAKVQIAEDSIEPVRRNVAAQGHTLHPDLLAAMSRMRMAIDTARKEIGRNDWASAQSSLNIAEANANRVLKFVGR